MSVGKSKDLLDMLDKKLSLTRRGFMKSVAAAGAAVGVIGSIGCSKKKSDGGGWMLLILAMGPPPITAAVVA